MERHIYIVSGEGERGTATLWTGKTVRALRAAVTRARAGGDRWARIAVRDGVDAELGAYESLSEAEALDLRGA